MNIKNNLKLNFFFIYSFGLQYLCLLFFSISDVLGSNYWNIRYLDNGDLWGDFTKWISSFNEIENYSIKISPLPILRRFDQNYFSYLNGSAYTNDPEKIADYISNFHMPPFSGLFAKTINFLSINFGPSNIYILILLFLFGYLFFLLIKKRSILNLSLTSAVIFSFLIFFDYPMQFAISKGNTGALISSLSVIYSAIFLVTKEKNKSLFWSIFASLNRPNLIFLTLLISLKYKPILNNIFPKYLNKYSNALITFTGFYIINSLNQLILWLIDNNYSFKNFKLGLATYHRMMALGDSGIAFGSSLHGLLKLTLKFLTGLSFKTELNYGISNIILYFCLLLGSVLSVLILIKFKSGILEFKESWLSLLILNLVATPVFADYHLSIFISSIILFNAFKKGNNSKNSNYIQLKEKIVYLYVAIMIAPWQIYIYPDSFPYGLGVIIRPLLSIIFIYLILNNDKFVFKEKVPS